MKKVFLTLLALSLSLALAGAAWGAASAPPKSLCLAVAGSGGKNISMSIKMQGTITFGAAKAKFYSITGELITASYSSPITGAGHVLSGVFHFTLNGTFFSASNFYPFLLEGKWNLADHNGTCNWSTLPPSWSGPADLTLLNCVDLNLVE